MPLKVVWIRSKLRPKSTRSHQLAPDLKSRSTPVGRHMHSTKAPLESTSLQTHLNITHLTISQPISKPMQASHHARAHHHYARINSESTRSMLEVSMTAFLPSGEGFGLSRARIFRQPVTPISCTCDCLFPLRVRFFGMSKTMYTDIRNVEPHLHIRSTVHQRIQFRSFAAGNAPQLRSWPVVDKAACYHTALKCSPRSPLDMLHHLIAHSPTLPSELSGGDLCKQADAQRSRSAMSGRR